VSNNILKGIKTRTYIFSVLIYKQTIPHIIVSSGFRHMQHDSNYTIL